MLILLNIIKEEMDKPFKAGEAKLWELVRYFAADQDLPGLRNSESPP